MAERDGRGSEARVESEREDEEVGRAGRSEEWTLAHMNIRWDRREEGREAGVKAGVRQVERESQGQTNMS